MPAVLAQPPHQIRGGVGLRRRRRQAVVAALRYVLSPPRNPPVGGASTPPAPFQGERRVGPPAGPAVAPARRPARWRVGSARVDRPARHPAQGKGRHRAGPVVAARPARPWAVGPAPLSFPRSSELRVASYEQCNYILTRNTLLDTSYCISGFLGVFRGFSASCRFFGLY